LTQNWKCLVTKYRFKSSKVVYNSHGYTVVRPGCRDLRRLSEYPYQVFRNELNYLANIGTSLSQTVIY